MPPPEPGGSYPKAQYHRIAARRGQKRAAVAVDHTILVAIHHVLKRKTVWQDLGSDDFDRRSREAVVRRLAKRIEALGFKVAVEVVA